MLILLMIVFMIGILVFFFTIRDPSKDNPRISLTINAVTGLPENNSTRKFSPSFNFTLSVIAHNRFGIFPRKFCYENGSIIVLYKKVELAMGPIPSFCSHKNKVQGEMLFASGKEVELPDFLQDQLFEEARNGVAVIAVDLKILDSYGNKKGKIVCRGKSRATQVFPCKLL
ncbi:hypothetical protein LUZ62_022853 [Rhynchospora pubera]|uniref:Late embryogenesis abundant protein LEA-2 subgroup domain-containing protein n=1 Tax=Rhynchospora pubera TaxID=906938 RepID=A0AAV8H6A5_9POAL|nr:hypothetical protein LUZ62_022853 [Rhynchospora pubera]